MSAAAPIFKNPRAVLIVAGVIVALLAAKQLRDLLAGVLGGAGKVVDAVSSGIANSYVNATHPGVQVAGDAYFLLPGGAKVTANQVTILAGGRFRYLGTTYELSESLGGGSYRAVRVG